MKKLFGYFFCHNRLGTRVSESLFYNQREFAIFVIPEEFWFAHFLSREMDFLWRLNLANQTHQQVSPFLHDRQTTTDMTTNFLQESDKLVYGPLVLLANSGEDSALPMVSSLISESCRYEDLVSLETPGWKLQWSLRSGSRRRSWPHNLWEGRCWPKGQTPHSRKRTGGLAPNRST